MHMSRGVLGGQSCGIPWCWNFRGRELPNVDSGNWTQVLGKSTHYALNCRAISLVPAFSFCSTGDGTPPSSLNSLVLVLGVQWVTKYLFQSYVCLHVHCVSEEDWIPWHSSYWWLWDALCVLGTDSESSARQPVLLLLRQLSSPSSDFLIKLSSQGCVRPGSSLPWWG